MGVTAISEKIIFLATFSRNPILKIDFLLQKPEIFFIQRQHEHAFSPTGGGDQGVVDQGRNPDFVVAVPISEPGERKPCETPVEAVGYDQPARFFKTVIELVHLPQKLFVPRPGVELFGHDTGEIEDFSPSESNDLLKALAFPKEWNKK